MVSQTNGTLPVMYSTPIEIQEETYEELSENHLSNARLPTANFPNFSNDSSDAVNESGNTTTSNFTITSINGNTEQYEDVPYIKSDYESLKKVLYKNMQSADVAKMYTGLENKKSSEV